MKAGVLFVKETQDCRVVGKRDEENWLILECSCGYTRTGFQDYWNLRSEISAHAARHALKIAAKS